MKCRLNREAREELYDPKRLTCKELAKQLKACKAKRTYDPKKKRKRSAWLSFVIAHKNMRTKKGLLDLKAISKLWKLRKAKLHNGQ